MSFRVCLVGVVLFLTTHGVFAQAVSDSSDSKLPRPEWLPANAKRLEVETKFLLAEGVGAERVDLGRLRTAQPYYFEVPFVNMLDRQVKITDLKSSCGCMVAARDDRRVGVGAASSFMVLVDAQQVPGRYAKTVTMITDAGIAWPFLVSAQFESHFKLSPARIKPDGKLKPIILTLTPQFTEAREYSVRVKALSGYLRVVGTTRGDHGEWMVECALTPDASRTNRMLIERLSVSHGQSDKLLCELALGIEARDRVVCKPTRIRMVKTGDEYVATVLLFGDREKIKLIADPMVLRFSCGQHAHREGTLEIVGTSDRVVRLKLRISDTVVGVCDAVTSAGIFSADVEICSVQELLFNED